MESRELSIITKPHSRVRELDLGVSDTVPEVQSVWNILDWERLETNPVWEFVAAAAWGVERCRRYVLDLVEWQQGMHLL
jgi:hypothetical protein